MNELPQIAQSTVLSAGDRNRGRRYLAIGAAANVAIWGAVLFLLKDAPRLYTSQCSIIFPREISGSRTKPAKPTSSTASDETPDPDFESVKASYQLIAVTDDVRRAAAAKVGVTTGQFGNPWVEVVKGTALMNFGVTGSTPEEAQRKAQALYEAFQERLAQLRVQQATELESGFENALSVGRKRLETAQLRLSDYKVRAGLASKEQIDQLASNIETLRRQRAELIAQQREVADRTQTLSSNLKISSQLAADAFALRVDPVFQNDLREYSNTTTQLADVSTKFGPNHPIVVRETAKQAALATALQERGQALLGHAVDLTAISRLNVGLSENGSAREGLFKDVVTSEAERQGLTARIQELDRQLFQLEQRLGVLAQRSSTLDALNRDVQIADSVFTSTLSGLDANRGAIFGSYPPVQLVAQPNLSTAATVPRQKPLFIIAAVLSGLVSLGLLLAWMRQVTGIKSKLSW